MKKRVVMIAGSGEEMKVLLERRESWSLPNDFHLRKDYRMGDRGEKPTFLYGEKPFELDEGFEWVPLNQLKELEGQDGAPLLEALATFWDFMPGAIQKVDMPRVFSKFTRNIDEVIFFGGSFNPWHIGHRTCLDLASAANPKAHFVVVPDSNPWKSNLPDGCRYSFYRELCETLAATNYSVYPGFCGMSEPNPTSKWFPCVSAPHKGLLMGDDSFFSLEDWIEAPTLLASLDHLMVVPRLEMKEEVERFAQGFSKRWPAVQITVMEEHPYADISSSAIRSKN